MKPNLSRNYNFQEKRYSLNNSVFIFVDWQVEYLSSGRAYALENLDIIMSNGLKILEMAREKGMTIAHFRKITCGTFFNKETRFSKWIDDFQPRPNEMVFEREKPSIYSSPNFPSFIDSLYFPELIMTGLTGEESGISTAIESSHRNHSLTYIKDATASHSIGNLNEKQSHKIISELVEFYSDVITTKEILPNLNQGKIIKEGIGHN